MKRTLLLILSVFIVLTLSGCGSSPANNGSNESSKTIELTFFYPIGVGGPLAKLIETQTKQFMDENPNIKLNAVFAGNSSETMTKTITAIQSGTSPDFAILGNSELYTLLSMNAITPLNDLIAKDGGDEYIDDFLPALMENSVYDNKIWSIPFQRSTLIAYYNKEHFIEAGLDPNKAPENWEELVEYGKKLTKKDAKGNVEQWGMMIPTDGFIFTAFSQQNSTNGDGLMTKDGKKALFNTEGNVDALQYIVDLNKKHGVMPEGVVKWETAPANFIEGKTSIIITTTGNLANIKNNAKFDFGTAFLPQGLRQGSASGGANIYIFKSSSEEKQEAAWKFIRWITEPERTAQWNVDTGYIATRKSAYETDLMKQYVQDVPQALTGKNQLDYAGSELRLYENGKNMQILVSAIESALTGSKTAEQALADAQAESDKVLAPFNK
ncbi:ABC transporter substrate-binding protein [Paenibacillus sp. IITD108]|uniref:ABC transporter substrate-binding protein n=1 Tax=Paenibacillus sp. IITD108 TaxID=3116649 RepID=UPI002F3EDE06